MVHRNIAHLVQLLSSFVHLEKDTERRFRRGQKETLKSKVQNRCKVYLLPGPDTEVDEEVDDGGAGDEESLAHLEHQVTQLLVPTGGETTKGHF